MSVRVNLLPHRAERRTRARQHFGLLAVATAVVGLLIVGGVHLVNAQRIATQDERNRFLKSEIAKLDKEIDEIKKLKEEIAALLARKQAIENLQADRAQTVHLLDELVRQTPEGVYLRTIKQTGLRVNMVGYAQSNARVSTVMRNIDSSPWLEAPVLVEIKAASVDKKRVSEFNLNFSVKRPEVEQAAKGAPKAAPAAKKG
ncbi:MAG: fimbrial protein [Betaproteobacteria bacterium RIFCSPLOWO2_02_FULL_66_14]|nr:MAG: fimbrial protein [Betaproteobacteria bacterium RIFCSPLOWO2_02_FULL_66_14]